MTIQWLACRHCGVKEWIQPHTGFQPCPACGHARQAEDDQGRPLVTVSVRHDVMNLEPVRYVPAPGYFRAGWVL